MSPEQTRGEPATRECDVFALGLVIYEVLTGSRAFSGDNLLRIFSEIREIDADDYAGTLPTPFDAIVRRALCRERAHRSITMHEIAGAVS